MSIGSRQFADWCYRQHIREIPNPAHPPRRNLEARRLARNVVRAHREVCGEECFELDQQPRSKLRAKADLTKPAILNMTVRLQDAKYLLMPSGFFWDERQDFDQ